MTGRDRKRLCACTFGVALLVAAAATAQVLLPKLPPSAPVGAGGRGPGRVLFNHATHVDQRAPGCVGCHPALFKMLAPGATADDKPLTHESMTKGAHCGACHDGKKSFGLTSDCMKCHRPGVK